MVISAEANSYIGWQAKLAHYSCLSRLGHSPLIVVHESHEQWPVEFAHIRKAGGFLVWAPSYRVTRSGRNYAPRNTAGTLLEAAHVVSPEIDCLLLCDPDVIFVRSPRVGSTLTGAACDYLDYAESPVRAAMRQLGLPTRIRAPETGRLCCGIPYVIPRRLAEPLALAWLDAIDAFPRPRWEDVMYAFGLAVLMLRLRFRRVTMADTNYIGDAAVKAPVVHYCYDTTLWTKRRFTSRHTARRVWRPPTGAVPGSVLAEIFGQLAEAHRFYEGVRIPSHYRQARNHASAD